MATLKNKISIHAADSVPEFVRADHPAFLEFVNPLRIVSINVHQFDAKLTQSIRWNYNAALTKINICECYKFTSAKL